MNRHISLDIFICKAIIVNRLIINLLTIFVRGDYVVTNSCGKVEGNGGVIYADRPNEKVGPHK